MAVASAVAVSGLAANLERNAPGQAEEPARLQSATYFENLSSEVSRNTSRVSTTALQNSALSAGGLQPAAGLPTPVARELDDNAYLTTHEFEIIQLKITAQHQNIQTLALDSYRESDMRQLTDYISNHMRNNGAFITSYISRLSLVRESLQQLRVTLGKKFNDESLHKWSTKKGEVAGIHEQAVVGATLSGAAEYEVEAKGLAAEVARIGALVSKAKADLARVAAEAAALEGHAAVAAEAAIAAEEEAVNARVAMETVRAATVKAKAEEDAKQKQAAQRARQKQEEEAAVRRRQETEAAERRRELDHSSAATAADKAGVDNWPRYMYNCEASDFDGGIACIVRAYPGVMSRESLIIECVPQLLSGFKLNDNEELIGNIIRIRPADPKQAPLFPEPAALAMPHCAPRNGSTKEPVIKCLVGAEWADLNTKDVTFDDIKDVRFVEAPCPSRFGTYAVVYRVKKEPLILTRRGGKLMSSVDGRVTLTSRPGTVKASVPLALQVQPIDQASVSDMKHRSSDECECLIASSPVVSFNVAVAANRTLVRPVTLTIPIPAAPSQVKRPPSAAPTQNGERRMAARPHTAASTFPFAAAAKTQVSVDDSLHLLVPGADGRWAVFEETLMQNKKGDLVTFDLKHLPTRVWLLRVKADTPTAEVERVADFMWEFTGKRVVRFVARQKAEDPTDVALACISAASGTRTERWLRRLEEDGYTDGPPLSSEFILSEGERIEVRFRGNIQCDEAGVDLFFPFNSQLPTRLSMYVCEADKFAQKGFDSYRGFTQFFALREPMAASGVAVAADAPADVALSGDKRKDRKGFSAVVSPRLDLANSGEVLLAEMLLCLPKQTDSLDTPKPSLIRAPIKFVSDGPIDEAFLHTLAADLGDEWKVLAQHLGIKRMRVQAIVRNNSKTDSEQIVYDMLMTWAKRVPRSVDKGNVLCSALHAVGRKDLVEDVHDREEDYRLQNADVARDAQMKRAFARIVQSEDALQRWHQLAAQLGLNESSVHEAEAGGGTTRERCLLCLSHWRETAGAHGTIVALARALKAVRMNDVAGDIFHLRHRFH